MKHDAFRMLYDMRMQAEESTEAEIMVYSDIVSYKWSDDDPEVTAKDFDRMLKEAKAAGASKLKLRINSPGGSVFQAVAMRAMLMTAGFDEIHVLIEGLCASAATLLCCVPGAKVSISSGSFFMIHNPSTYAYGTAADLGKTIALLEKMQQDDYAMYSARCGKGEDQVKEWMDAETWFTAEEAVQAGFADELLEGMEAVACASDAMHLMRDVYQKVPQMPEKQEDVSNAELGVAAGDASQNTQTEEDVNMEIKDITMDMLREGNSALYDQIMQQGAVNERERIQEIDDLTPAGYEQMAQTAKEQGTDAVAYCKMIAKAQREKGTSYLAARTQETQPAQQVKGEEPVDHVDAEAELKKLADDAAVIAAEMRHDVAFGMY